MSDDDARSIRAHNFKVDVNLGARSYTKLARAFPELTDLLSLQRLQTRIAFLSGIKPVSYHCCVNSCCCFTRNYALLNECPFCHEARYDSHSRPRNTFEYLPLTARLSNMFLNKNQVRQMDYRSMYEHHNGPAEDVFDGQHYLRLLRTNVTIGDETLPYRFFSQPTDIAIGLSTDGFCPFKRRKQTCWPVIGINYNLPPSVRYELHNLICFGIIPGPRQPKDMDSYLVPLVDEFHGMMRGSEAAFDVTRNRQFSLRAYPILLFGDMPAVAKLMRMKGHNGIHPCRACHIQGVRDPDRANVTAHYTPLYRADGHSYDPLNLPRRTHDQFMRHAIQVSTAPDAAEADRRAKHYGINGIPILTTISSLSFPESCPHGFMHIIENIIPALTKLWTGDYKDMDAGSEDYQLPSTVWDAIGQACSESGITIPSSFGCRVPNIATERHHFIAESWLLFTTLVAPTVLRARFSRRLYYDHFVQLVKVINRCLQIQIEDEDIEFIRHALVDWVLGFERFVRLLFFFFVNLIYTNI